MIPDEIILFIIMLVLSYCFDTKLLPQFGILAFALIEEYLEVISIVVSGSQTNVLYVLLFIINIFYCLYLMIKPPEVENVNGVL